MEQNGSFTSVPFAHFDSQNANNSVGYYTKQRCLVERLPLPWFHMQGILQNMRLKDLEIQLFSQQALQRKQWLPYWNSDPDPHKQK